MRTVIDAIVASAGGTGTLTVAADGDTPVVRTWADVHRHARRMAGVLAAAGLGRGGRVGVLGDTSAGLVVAMQAAWLSGASVTVLPWPARRDPVRLLRPVVVDAGLDLVVAAEPDAGLAAGLAPTRVLPLGELVRRARSATPAIIRTPDPDDLAVLQYTSGSTRFPRGVPVTHGHLAANVEALRETLLHPGSGPPLSLLSWLPLYHDMGLVGFLVLPMSFGHPLVLQTPTAFARRPASWPEALSRYRVAVTGAPDFAYRIVTPLLEAGLDLDLSAVRLMLSGAEPVSVDTMTRFVAAATRYGLDAGAVVPAYGLAEATLAVTCARRGAGLTADRVDPDVLERDGRAVPVRPGGRVRVLARLGQPLPGVRLRVVDRHTGAPLGDRDVGEVEIRGASVVGHYWREPRPPAGTWMRTGDLGYLADGDLMLCGRAKDVLFAGGRNLHPVDVELAAGRVPGVRPGGAVAFGVPGEHGDRLVVLVEARGVDRSALCRAVTVAVTAEIGMRPAEVLTLPPGRLPRTTSGKLRRPEARRRYLCGELEKGYTDEHTHRGTGTGPVAGRVPAGVRGTA